MAGERQTYVQRANRRGWVHYSDDGWTHVTTRDWWRWLGTWFHGR